ARPKCLPGRNFCVSCLANADCPANNVCGFDHQCHPGCTSDQGCTSTVDRLCVARDAEGLPAGQPSFPGGFSSGFGKGARLPLRAGGMVSVIGSARQAFATVPRFANAVGPLAPAARAAAKSAAVEKRSAGRFASATARAASTSFGNVGTSSRGLIGE